MTSTDRENVKGAEVSMRPNYVSLEEDPLTRRLSASDHPSLQRRAIQLQQTHGGGRNGNGHHQGTFLQGTAENEHHSRRPFNPNATMAMAHNGNDEGADTDFSKETSLFPMLGKAQVSSNSDKSAIHVKEDETREYKHSTIDIDSSLLYSSNEEQSFLQNMSVGPLSLRRHDFKANGIPNGTLNLHSASPAMINGRDVRTRGNREMETNHAITLSTSAPVPIDALPYSEDQDNSTVRMPPQSRGPLHTDLKEHTINDVWMRQTKDAALLVDADISNNGTSFDKSATSIKHDYIALDQIKAQLYLESVKSHRGRGAERQFADYWYALGCYIVSEKTGNSKTIRSGSDPCANGIEGVLKSFLKTKRLRRLHNKLIRTLLKQSLETIVPKKRFQSHIPGAWDNLIERSTRENRNDIQGTGKSLIETKTSLHKRGGSKKDSICTTKFEDVFGAQSGLYTALGSDDISISNVSHINALRQNGGSCNRASDNDQHRLPGLLEIEPIVKKLAQKDNIVVSGSAMGLMVVAIREHISGILKNAILLAEEESEQKSQADIDTNRNDSDKRGDTFQKSKLISSFELLRSLSCKSKQGQQLPSTTIKSRSAWERCVSGVALDSQHIKSTEVAEIQKKLNKSILTPSLKLQEHLILKRNAEDLVKSVDEKSENDSTKRRRMVIRRSSHGAGGMGKDLQAMRARLDSRQNSLAGDLSSKGSKRPTTPASQISEQRPESSEGNVSGTSAGRNKGEKDLQQMRNRSRTSSPGSIASNGRGRGFKDLASMRNRATG